MERQQIIVDNKTYEVVATIHDNETNKDFVIYRDEVLDKIKGLTLACVLYYEKDGEFVPIKITEAKDKEIASELVKLIMEKLSK